MENNQQVQDEIIDENLENSFYEEDEIPREVVECDIEFLVTKNFCKHLQQSNTRVNPRIDGRSSEFGEMLLYALSLEPYRINRQDDESEDEDMDGANTPPVSPPETPIRLIKIDVDRMNESLADSEEYHIVNDMETSDDDEEEEVDINNNTIQRAPPQPRRIVVNRLQFHVNRLKRIQRRRFRRSSKYFSRDRETTIDGKAIKAISENLDRKREIVALRAYARKLMELNQMPQLDFDKMWNNNFVI